MPPCHARAHKGFTLVELVTVIIVLGLVSVGISGFIRTGVTIYGDVIEREQLLGDSRFVVERINRELRSAVPNSIRVTTNVAETIQCIEFVPAEWVTFYTSLSVEPDTTASATIVELADNVAGFALDSGDFAIVYPTSNDDVYNTSADKRIEIMSCSNEDSDCSLSDDAGTAQLTLASAFADHSPASRLYIAREAISYCVYESDTSIYRHQNDINTTATTYDADDGVLMAENLVNDIGNVDELPFTVVPATLTRNGLVQILLAFERNQEIINFHSEVHIPNVP